jgi:hypothetical protein
MGEGDTAPRILDGGEWTFPRPGHLKPRETAPGTKWLGGYVGPRAGLHGVVRKKR